MAGGGIQIENLFGTLLAAVMLPDAETCNAELEDIILRRRAEHETVDASNVGGWHSTCDLPQWGGKRVEEILNVARSMVSEMTTDQDGKPVRPDWVVEAWANVSGHGHSNSTHYHPGSFWSGTYYVRDGGCAEDPSLGGELVMYDPRGRAPWMHDPSLRYRLSAGNAKTIQPRAGLILIFPSFLAHGVRPYRGERLRISIAFNLASSSPPAFAMR